MGREKMKMKKIEDISARQVTFSKRRQGLFKKARELSTLCEAEVTAFVVSPAGKLHHYASSKMEDTLGKFSIHVDKEQQSQEENKHDVDSRTGIDEKMNRLRLIMSMQLHQWGIEEVQQLETLLEATLKRVSAKKKEIMLNEVPASVRRKLLDSSGVKEEPVIKASSRLPVRLPSMVDTSSRSSEFRHCDQEIVGPMSNMKDVEGPCFPLSLKISKAHSGVRIYTEKWTPPPTDVYKANFAGANFQEMNASGTGVVVRNWKGEFMAAQARFLPERMNENEVLSMAAKSAVEFAVDYNFTHIIFEGDSHEIINMLEDCDEKNPSDTACALKEAKSCAKKLDRCFFSHVQRSGNNAAHVVAQYATNVKDEVVWLIEEPEFLDVILLADAVH